jgi:hypothetical protein
MGTKPSQEMKWQTYEQIYPIETYPSQLLTKWLNIKTIEARNLKFKESNNEMKEVKNKLK